MREQRGFEYLLVHDTMNLAAVMVPKLVQDVKRNSP
jgi:hypothetical protein